MIYFAGIGSRQTPSIVLSQMSKIAFELAVKGYILRSGGAIGADHAFEAGCDLNKSVKEIFRVKDCTKEAISLAEQFHPNWGACNEYVRKLHGRNAQIILGQNLDKPVKFVLCYTTNGKDIGGTGLGIRLAEKYEIPVYNFFHYVPIIENL